MRTHRAERRRRAEGALAHLLLVVVLALGVFLMHAVGHPEGSAGGMGTGSASAHHSVAPHGDEGADTDTDAGHEPGSGMDMTTLCVAVLAGWLFAGLVRAALGRRPDWLTLLLARLTPALGPHAPPPLPPDLAQLSVLRI
ncbi:MULTISPECIES: DUF6153 family protein [unclassified Streptomyces]|uniref:DUF6153 family protein n=1 Tax=unclassified Streptomyces TaxID=2593676 RepID=UPI0016567402|nr:DUF6153 family protein [Streptomyces sp. CB02980]MCB8901749.1 DUF6153 family protein [Streptomyces sp. CB02980]